MRGAIIFFGQTLTNVQGDYFNCPSPIGGFLFGTEIGEGQLEKNTQYYDDNYVDNYCNADVIIIITICIILRFEWTILALAVTSLGLKHDADYDSLKV